MAVVLVRALIDFVGETLDQAMNERGEGHGEDAGEIAGFVEALRARIPDWREVRPAIDWPSYAAGRKRGAPLFLLFALRPAADRSTMMLHPPSERLAPSAKSGRPPGQEIRRSPLWIPSRAMGELSATPSTMAPAS